MAWIEKVFERDGAKRRIGTTSKGSKDRPTDAQMRAQGWKVTGYLVGYREPSSGRRVSRTFPAKADAETFRREIERSVAAGDYISRSDRAVPLREYVGRLLHGGWNLAPSTIASQRGTYRRHIDPVLGHRPIGAITRHELADLIARLVASENAHGRGTSVATYELLAKIMNAAVRDGVLNRSPLAGVARPSARRNGRPRSIPAPSRRSPRRSIPGSDRRSYSRPTAASAPVRSAASGCRTSTSPARGSRSSSRSARWRGWPRSRP